MAKVHCCETMANYIDPKCDLHANPADCEDALASYDPSTDSYALLPRFEASWVTTINFCPWCGDKKRDLSDEWEAELDKLGHDWSNNVPVKFQTDAWWRKKGL